MDKIDEKPKVMWAFWASVSGSFFNEPKKVVWDEDTKKWWAKDGNNEIDEPGLTEDNLYVTYAHKSKKKIKAFMKGYEVRRITFEKRVKLLISEAFGGN